MEGLGVEEFVRDEHAAHREPRLRAEAKGPQLGEAVGDAGIMGLPGFGADLDEAIAFFTDLGMTVVPTGPNAGTAVTKALRENQIVCLLSDRDIERNGVDVEFFGERTTLPGGPATLALRSGAPLLPATCYFDGASHHGVVLPPLDTTRRGKLREDVARVTQDLAHALEILIRREPTQWHLLQPNWPSGVRLLAGAKWFMASCSTQPC